jgi:mannose-6-phosphate isomerase-like protein (cupin superfamily)
MQAATTLPRDPDLLAPDGSEIRLLPAPEGGGASLVHCRLPAGATAKAVTHRTVEEVWHVIAGRGELWQARGERNEVATLGPGVSVTIPLGTRFQFRNTGSAPLDIVIVTLPPWPGAEEAIRVADHWPVPV